MFNFIQSIFMKVTTVITSVLITVGLVSAPVQPTQTELNAPTSTIQKQELGGDILETESKIEEVKTVTVITKPVKETTIVVKSKATETAPQDKIQSDAEKLRIEIDKVKSQVEATKRAIEGVQIIPQEPITPVVTEPIVEENQLQIVSFNVTSSVTSAKIEWKTNLPTESKIFILENDEIVRIILSETGLSTRHVVNINGLASSTSYFYELESIADGRAVKRVSSFTTVTPPPPPPPPPLPLYESRITHVTQIINNEIFVHLSLKNKTGNGTLKVIDTDIGRIVIDKAIAASDVTTVGLLPETNYRSEFKMISDGHRENTISSEFITQALPQ